MRTYKANMIPGGTTPVINVSQYDNDYAVTVTLIEGAEIYTPPAGATIRVEGTKPDGHGFEYPCTYQGNVVTMPINTQMTVVSGRFPIELVVYQSGLRVGSCNIIFAVEKAPLGEDTVISETVIPDIIAGAQAQADAAASSATSAVSARNAAIEAAQAAAQSAASLTVDTELSSTSTNPVQNKVIDATVTELKNDLINNLDYNDIPQNIEKLALVNSQISDAATHGITLTKVNDTSFILNGTATGQVVTFNLDFNAVTLSEQMYYFLKRSDGLTEQSGVWVQMGYFNDSGAATQLTTIANFNTVVPFTFPSAAKKSRNYLRIGAGATFDNVRFDILAFNEMPLLQTVDTILDDAVDRYDSIMFLHPITSVGDQSIYVHSGDTIVINVDSNTIATSAYIAPYMGGDPSVSIAVGSGTFRLTATKSGWLKLQGTNTAISATAYVESRFDSKIATLEQSIIFGGEVYTVKKDGTGDYTSFVACLKALASNSNQKTIYVYDGAYDIYEELGGDAFIATITNPSGTNWRDVNPIVPPNTKIVGCGNVTLQFLPTASQIGSNEMAYLFSPLNISGSCEIENISIEATNCRYAIHDESSGLSQYDDTVHVYRNVRAHKTKGTYGLNPTYGSGLGARSKWLFENCKFTNDIGVCWTVHTTNSVAPDMATIVFNSCVFAKDDGIAQTGIMQFINGGGAHLSEKEIVNINNCYIGGRISIAGGGGSTNRYALSILNTHMAGDVVVDSTITSNPYTPEVYN